MSAESPVIPDLLPLSETKSGIAWFDDVSSDPNNPTDVYAAYLPMRFNLQDGQENSETHDSSQPSQTAQSAQSAQCRVDAEHSGTWNAMCVGVHKSGSFRRPVTILQHLWARQLPLSF